MQEQPGNDAEVRAELTMTTKQALMDIMLQQRETINWLRAYERSVYEISREAITRHQEERDYWKVRCAGAEDKLINIKLFGKL
jgi:hypothetical protein